MTRRTDEFLVTGLFSVVAIGLLIAAIIQDVRVPLWTDELLTLFVSEEPSIAGVFSAIHEGVDNQPPLYDLILRPLRPIIASESPRVRLPSTIGFFVMCVCLFVFVRRRLPALYAMLAALVAMRVTWIYSFEGRPYGLVLGCVGLALVCWQTNTETGAARAAVGLSFSLAAAIAFHYFAVFVICPFGAVELIRWVKLRKVNFPVLAALTLPLTVIPLHLSLIRAGRPFMKYFWAKAELATVYNYYLQTFSPLSLVLVLCLVCALYAGVRRVRHRKMREIASHRDEWILGLGLMLLPEVVIFASLLTFKLFTDRYVIWSAIGVGITLAFGLHRFVDSERVLAVAVLPLLVWSSQTTIQAATSSPEFRWAGNLKEVLKSVPDEPKPIIVTGLHAFMELWFYAQPELRSRLVYLIDEDLERRYLQSDTTTRILSALRQRIPVGAVDFRVFVATNSHFIVAGDLGDWILPHLRALNYRFVLLTDGGTNKVYEVYAPTE